MSESSISKRAYVIDEQTRLLESDIEWQAIRAQGAGGQNVNKVSSAVHLRFDIQRSSLPDLLKQLLLNHSDKRISKTGVIVIKAQQHRKQELNRAEAVDRLIELIKDATRVKKTRVATKPSRTAVKRRLNDKQHRSEIKASRSKPTLE